MTDYENFNCVSCGNAEGFWTICSDGTTKFQNVGKPVLTKSGNSKIAVKRRGELVCKDTWDKSINTVTYTKIQPTIRLRG